MDKHCGQVRGAGNLASGSTGLPEITDRKFSNAAKWRCEMKKMLLIFLFSSFVLLTGCSCFQSYVQGKEITSEQLAKFSIGKTTKNEVVVALGDPQEYKFDGGKQILTYKYEKVPGYFDIAGAPKEQDTTFIFNEKGVLQDILKSGQSGAFGNH